MTANENTHTRKIRGGNRELLLSLPREVIEKYNLDKGSEVFVKSIDLVVVSA